jgi:hypothetical protein
LDKNDSDLIAKNLANFFPKMSYSTIHRKGESLKPLVNDFIVAINKVSKDFLINKKL